MNTLKKLVVASLLCVTGFTMRAQGLSTSSSMDGTVKLDDKKNVPKAASIGGTVTNGLSATINPSAWPVTRNEVYSNYIFSAVLELQDHGKLPGGASTNRGDALFLPYFAEENVTGDNAIGMWFVLPGGTNHPVSASKISWQFVSGDVNHYLSETRTFAATNTYSDGLVLKQRQGTSVKWVNSGPLTQEGEIIIGGVPSRHFNDALAAVKEYGYNNPDWPITFNLMYDGVQVASYTINKGTAGVALYVVNGELVIYPRDLNNPVAYMVQVSDSLAPNATWTDLKKISGYQSVTNAPPAAGQNLFFRSVYKP